MKICARTDREAQLAQLAKHETENPEAYRLYLQGLFYWNKWTEEGFRKAIDLFQSGRRKRSELRAERMPASRIPTTFWASPGYDAPSKVGRTQRSAAMQAVKLDDQLARGSYLAGAGSGELRLGLGGSRE